MSLHPDKQKLEPQEATAAWLYPVTAGHLILATTICAALTEASWPGFMWIVAPLATLTFNLAALMRFERTRTLTAVSRKAALSAAFKHSRVHRPRYGWCKCPDCVCGHAIEFPDTDLCTDCEIDEHSERQYQ